MPHTHTHARTHKENEKNAFSYLAFSEERQKVNNEICNAEQSFTPKMRKEEGLFDRVVVAKEREQSALEDHLLLCS
jgi:hypothetical protein